MMMMKDAKGNDIAVFSPRTDELITSMFAGETPNVGRFCGYCYTPMKKRSDTCSYCGRHEGEYGTVNAIPSDFLQLHRRMRKRESLIVNSFAFLGLGIGLLLFIVLVALAVLRYDQSLWMLVAATAVFIVGGRVFAGILGGWLGDSIGYDYAQRKLAEEWAEYDRQREAARRGEREAPVASGEPSASAG
jgi:hypothetical protein